VTARGICEQNDVGYLKASNMEEAKMGIVALLVEERQRPLLLEVFTDADADSKALADYFNLFERKRT
jgi:2-succinyl-5-enolpyruvyl-6-hydroxy-3-cyclohexene-1-carboxylate synthase